MAAPDEKLEEEVVDAVVWVKIPLDAKTQDWLVQVALATGQPPEIIAGCVLRDVADDDEVEYLEETRAEIGSLH